MRNFNGKSKQRRKVKTKLYYQQEGRCKECRRSITLDEARLTRIDNTTKSCAQTNLRIVCMLCIDFIDKQRSDAGRARKEATPDD